MSNPVCLQPGFGSMCLLPCSPFLFLLWWAVGWRLIGITEGEGLMFAIACWDKWWKREKVWHSYRGCRSHKTMCTQTFVMVIPPGGPRRNLWGKANFTHRSENKRDDRYSGKSSLRPQKYSCLPQIVICPTSVNLKTELTQGVLYANKRVFQYQEHFSLSCSIPSEVGK